MIALLVIIPTKGIIADTPINSIKEIVVERINK
jgi:hypothetical protein